MCRPVGALLPVIAGKLAIVIDDFGYRPHNENRVLAMPSAISVAVLPDSPHARDGDQHITAVTKC
ncbi:hypothetical protein DMI70_08685 [Escherichia coli]|nr:hypothetical protein [Escherichia coli]